MLAGSQLVGENTPWHVAVKCSTLLHWADMHFRGFVILSQQGSLRRIWSRLGRGVRLGYESSSGAGGVWKSGNLWHNFSRSKILKSLSQGFGQVQNSEIFVAKVRAGPKFWNLWRKGSSRFKILKSLSQGFQRNLIIMHLSWIYCGSIGNISWIYREHVPDASSWRIKSMKIITIGLEMGPYGSIWLDTAAKMIVRALRIFFVFKKSLKIGLGVQKRGPWLQKYFA